VKLLLDTNVLARLCHPTGYQDVKDWFRSLLLRGADAPEILVPVLVDYELRRSLVGRGASTSLAHLDSLAQSMTIVPVTAEIARRAAEISASLGADKHKQLPDGDILIAATAQTEGAVLVTSDVDFRSIPGVTAKDWSEIAPET
jgi:predicted nucleic acid-binding protein